MLYDNISHASQLTHNLPWCCIILANFTITFIIKVFVVLRKGQRPYFYHLIHPVHDYTNASEMCESARGDLSH